MLFLLYAIFDISIRAVTSLISLIIFGFELEQKGCMQRLPWNLLELIYPIFMVLLIAVAAIGNVLLIYYNLYILYNIINNKNEVGLITGATLEDGPYKSHCFASSILGLLDCIPWSIQAFFQFSINRSL